MVYSHGKSKLPERRRRGARVLFLALGVVILAAIASVALMVFGFTPFGVTASDSALLEEWNAGNYRAVAALASDVLSADPLDGEALVFAGFADFYLGMEAVQQEEQVALLDDCIANLRKADVLRRAPFPEERDYVLGKAYFHKGVNYMDLAIRYLQASVEEGHETSDSRTYLGLAHAELGQYDESVAWFEEAIARADPEDVNPIRLEAADSYAAAGDYESAKATLEAAVDSLDDEFLLLIARNKLASVMIRAGHLDAAQAVLEETIDQYPESADAYYYLGVIYDEINETVLARDYWRRAREIDPDHEDALRRLANREG
jgi:tetratricopeptide (TPR) repeat protein